MIYLLKVEYGRLKTEFISVFSLYLGLFTALVRKEDLKVPKEKGGKKNQAETVERLTEQKVLPIIERYGYELWDVIFEKEGAMWYLKVLFDKADGGIDDAECEEITEPLNKAVDTLPCIDLVDVFEVGAPGLDRQLRKPFHFVKMKGERIKVTVRDENGKTAYNAGVLADYDENSGVVTLQTDDGDLRCNAAKCRRIALDA